MSENEPEWQAFAPFAFSLPPCFPQFPLPYFQPVESFKLYMLVHYSMYSSFAWFYLIYVFT